MSLISQTKAAVLSVRILIPGGQDTCDPRTAVPVHFVVEPQRRPAATRAAAPATAPGRRHRRPCGGDHDHPGVAAGSAPAPPPGATAATGV